MTTPQNFTHISDSTGSPICHYADHPEYEWPAVMPMSGCLYCRKQIDEEFSIRVDELEQNYLQQRVKMENVRYDLLVDFERKIQDNQVAYINQLNRDVMDKHNAQTTRTN